MTEQDEKPVQMRRVFRESFNPDGRPTGSKNRRTILREIASQQYPVMQDGKKRQMLLLHIVVMNLCQMALEGTSSLAIREYERILEKYDPEAIHENAGYIVAPAEMTPEEWMAEQIEKNKTRKPPPGAFDDDEDWKNR